MIIRRTLGAVIVHAFAAIIWGMDRTIDEDLWEEASHDRRACARPEPSR
jgi:hypothetical protein